MSSEMRYSPANYVASFRTGDHVSLFYRDVPERDAALVSYLQIGLLLNERCLCVLPRGDGLALMEALEAAGVDTENATERGALLMFTPEETYLQGDSFDPLRMTALLRDAIRESIEKGFRGFRS